MPLSRTIRVVEPTLGGQDLFVHLKAFPSGTGRPSVGQALSFEVETARALQYVVRGRPSARFRSEASAPPSTSWCYREWGGSGAWKQVHAAAA